MFFGLDIHSELQQRLTANQAVELPVDRQSERRLRLQPAHLSTAAHGKC